LWNVRNLKHLRNWTPTLLINITHKVVDPPIFATICKPWVQRRIICCNALPLNIKKINVCTIVVQQRSIVRWTCCKRWTFCNKRERSLANVIRERTQQKRNDNYIENECTQKCSTKVAPLWGGRWYKKVINVFLTYIHIYPLI
jgi:hypothetical protein